MRRKYDDIYYVGATASRMRGYPYRWSEFTYVDSGAVSVNFSSSPTKRATLDSATGRERRLIFASKTSQMSNIGLEYAFLLNAQINATSEDNFLNWVVRSITDMNGKSISTVTWSDLSTFSYSTDRGKQWLQFFFETLRYPSNSYGLIDFPALYEDCEGVEIRWQAPSAGDYDLSLQMAQAQPGLSAFVMPVIP